MQTPPETTVKENNPALVSTKGLTKQPNSNPCKSSKSCKTFSDEQEFSVVRTRQVLQQNFLNCKSSKSRNEVLQVLQLGLFACKNKRKDYSVESVLSSKFHWIYKFYRGVVGGVSQ